MKWRKSSRCDTQACVEVLFSDLIRVRNSAKNVELEFSPRDWQKFLNTIRSES